METNMIFERPSTNMIREFVKEMKNFSKEELEGVKSCIENDKNVTYKERSRGGYVDSIHGDHVVCVYLMADFLLKKYA